MDTFTSKQKQALRRQLRQRRRALVPAQIDAYSRDICRHLCHWPVFLQAAVIMSFMSLPEEVDTRYINRVILAQGKTLCIPYLSGEAGVMEAAVITDLEHDTTTGPYGLQIPRPDKLQLLPPQHLEVILVPGVAFDRYGHRLGMGGGYYDRFLGRAAGAARVGVGFSLQVVEMVPSDNWDVSVTHLVTEQGLFSCRWPA